MTLVSQEVLKQVKTIELRTRGLVSSLFAGEYRSTFRGQGMEFAEVRAYEIGDDYRTIDWSEEQRVELHQKFIVDHYLKQFNDETIANKQ